MLAGGLAPYLALAVKKATTDENNNVNMPANIAGHALAGAVVAYLQGGSVAGGAAGAAGGELAAHAIMAELYPNSTVDSLTSEQKANISALSTLAGALAGGVAVNSSNAIGAGAVAGKVAVENNALRVAENKSRSEEFVRCQGNADCVNGVNEKYKKISAEQHESVVNCKGAQDCVDKANEVGKLQADYANRANELKEYARIHGSLTPEQQNELSILEGTSIQLEADRTEAIHRAMMSGDSPEANKLAIDALAQAVGTSAAGIAAGVGKGKTVGEGVVPDVKPSEPAIKPGSGSKPEGKPSSSAENVQSPTGSVLDEKKFDYLFGRASGSKHNLDRTNQLALEMKRLGVMDDTNGRSVISEHFNSITKNPNNIVKQYTDQYGSFEVRESFFIGPSGKATTFESTFEVMPDSSHRFITTIPKNGATK